MKKIILHILFLLPLTGFGQLLPQKTEDYKSYAEELEPTISTPIIYSDLSFDHGMQNKASWLMMSYLNLYEATKDKAYLVKFINVSIECILQRYDVTHNLGFFEPFSLCS